MKSPSKEALMSLGTCLLILIGAALFLFAMDALGAD